MTSTTTTEAPAPAALQRRIDDLALPGQPLEWGEEGTPLPGASVVHQYRLLNDRFERWMDIRTQEHLLEVQAAPDRFKVRIMFTVPVDDISRAPVSFVAAAQTRLDIIHAATGAAIANLRAVAREIAELP